MSGTNPFASNLSMFGQAASQPPGQQQAPMFGQFGAQPPMGAPQAPMFGQSQQGIPNGAPQPPPQIDYSALFQALMQNPQLIQQLQGMQASQPSPGAMPPPAAQFQPTMPPAQASPFPSVTQMLAKPPVPEPVAPAAPVGPQLPPDYGVMGGGGESGGM